MSLTRKDHIANILNVNGVTYKNTNLWDKLVKDLDESINTISKLPEAPKPMIKSERNWKEDFSHENGNYQCTCVCCGKGFIGHKRRVVCKVCDGAQEVTVRIHDLSTKMNVLAFLDEKVDVDFSGVKIQIERSGLKFKVTNAVDGYGNNVRAFYINSEVIIEK